MGARGIYNRKCTVDADSERTITEKIITVWSTGELKFSRTKYSFEELLDSFKSSDISFAEWFKGRKEWMADHESSFIFWHLLRKQHVVS